jgi:membrane protein YqaA with SNARE-associated domain
MIQAPIARAENAFSIWFSKGPSDSQVGLNMESLKQFLLALGIPGVILIAALDSGGIPLPGGPDAVVMLVSWQRPALVPVVALAAALGSTVGCYFLYLVGRRGGSVALRRFDKEKTERRMDQLRRNDWLAVFVSVIGPPPFPTKVFILGAGVIRMPWKRFVLSVFTGRFLRFLVEGYLGARFGEQAADLIRAHHTTILLALLTAVGIYIVIKRLLVRREADAA